MAVGAGWCAAFTTANYVRVFSADGRQKTLLSQGTPVVSMSGYENLLAIVCHGGPPVYGCQSYRLKVVNMESYAVVVDTDCPVSRDAVINWLGFSEEGQLMTYCTEGVLRAFNFRNK